MYKTEDFTRLRLWYFDETDEISCDSIKASFKDLIGALEDVSMAVCDDFIDAKQTLGESEYPAVKVYHKNAEYMPVYIISFEQGSNIYVSMGVAGKGEQVKAEELEKLYVRAAGSVSNTYAKIKNGIRAGRNLDRRFGGTGTGGAIGAGIGTVAGAAIGGSIRLAAKGLKALLRDREAYEREMGFYSSVISMGDYLMGGADNDSYFDKIRQNAEKGNVTAQYMTGLAYMEGRDVEADFNHAISWFDKAAKNGERRSREIIVGEYLYGENHYTLTQKEEAVTYLIQMADGGDLDAITTLILIYGDGCVKGIETNIEKALVFAERYKDSGNNMALMWLAHACDTAFSGNEKMPVSYKNDVRAVSLYNELKQSDDPEYSGVAYYNLGHMYQEGRGVGKSDISAVECYSNAYAKGIEEAGEGLLRYYIAGQVNDTGLIKNICAKIIAEADEKLMPLAYYCSFIIEDRAGMYKQSMDFAKAYIACANAEDGKKCELRKYLDDKEDQISRMSEEERMEFFHEKKPMLYGLRKAIAEQKKNGKLMHSKTTIIVAAVIALVIIAALIVIISKHSSGDEAVNNEYGIETSHEEASDQIETKELDEALNAYNEFLSTETIEVTSQYNGNTRIWRSVYCDFSLPYISNDSVPDLMIYNYADNDHVSGYGALFKYHDGNVQLVGMLSLNDVRGIGYYRGTGYFMDHYASTGLGKIMIQHIEDLSDIGVLKHDLFEINLEYDAEGTSHVTGYDMELSGEQSMENVSESEFNEKLRADTGGESLIEYEFFHNTEENRNDKLLKQ